MNAPSFLETPNAVHRRKVFMHVLTPLSNSRKALEAVVLWEKHYGSQEMLLANIVEYCKLLCDKQTFEMNAEQLSQMLITGLLKKSKEYDDVYDPIGLGKILLEKEVATNCTSNPIATSH